MGDDGKGVGVGWMAIIKRSHTNGRVQNDYDVHSAHNEPIFYYKA